MAAYLIIIIKKKQIESCVGNFDKENIKQFNMKKKKKKKKKKKNNNNDKNKFT